MKHNFMTLYYWSSKYTYRYLANSSSRIVAKFKQLERLGSNSNFKVGNKFQNAPIAPPNVEGCNG